MNKTVTHGLGKIGTVLGGRANWFGWHKFAECECGKLVEVYVGKNTSEEGANKLLQQKFLDHCGTKKA